MSIRRPGRCGCRSARRASTRSTGRSGPATWRGASRSRGPDISGIDAAGVVDEVGEGVTDVAVGDDVFGLGSATSPSSPCSRPMRASRRRWTGRWPAAAGVAAETAIRAFDLVGVKAGSTVLIDGGAGGVGAVAVQIALARGATVIASASEGNQDYLREIRRHPGAVRRRIGRAGPGDRAGRGRRRLRRGRQDAAGRPDQPGARAVPGGHHRQLQPR